MHGYPVMQFVQYSVGPPPPPCSWVATPESRGLSAAAMGMSHRPGSQSIKKYVIWCLVCGGFSCLLGALFLGVYFLLHSYTITVGNFETVPTFVPATLLILTGLCIMSLARRRNRYSYLIKLSGACGLTSALTCALVTVTTTVLHMSRLQALRECEYAQKTRTCTCYSDMIESQVDRVDKEGVRLVFDSLSDCGVVHGSLYSCLRAIFGLSVAGVLVAVFSCMLVYQLLSHERKKMYWEQLELRCRSLYTSHQQHQQHQPQSALTGMSARSAPMCRCCEQCHAHRQLQLQTASYPWVDDSGEPRFWAGQPPGNFYSPNPGGDDNHLHGAASGTAVPANRSRQSSGWSWPRMPWQRNSTTESGGGSRRFRQIPSSPDSQYGFSSANNSLGLAVSNAAGEEDAAAAAIAAVAAATATQRAAQAYNIVNGSGALPYGIWGPPPPYSDPNSPARRGYYHYMQPSNSLCTTNRVNEHSGAIGSLDVDVNMTLQQRPLSESALNASAAVSTQNIVVGGPRTFDHISQRHGCTTVDQLQQNVYKSKDNNADASNNNDYVGNGDTGSESDAESVPTRPVDRYSNTLPSRKIKKRVVDGTSSIAKCVGSGSGSGSRNQLNSHRITVQRVFPNSSNSTSENDADIKSHSRPLNSHSLRYSKTSNNNKNNRSAVYSADIGSGSRIFHNTMITDPTALQRCNDLLENNTCVDKCEGNNSSTGSVLPNTFVQNSDTQYEDPIESETYFADVSSCCNMSMKNDVCFIDSNRTSTNQSSHQTAQRSSSKKSQINLHPRHHHSLQQQPQKQQHQQHHLHQRSNCSQCSNPSSIGSGCDGVSAGGFCCASEEDNNFSQHDSYIRNRQNHNQCRLGDAYNKKSNTIVMNGDGKDGDMILKNSKNEVNSIPKDNSLHSICSIDSEAKTECTDLSPLTPCSNKNPTETIYKSGGKAANNANVNAVPQTLNVNSTDMSNFIASFPSESKFHEAHRRFTKHMRDNLIAATTTTLPMAGETSVPNESIQEAHYEIIHDENPSNKNNNNNKTITSHKQRPKNFNINCSYEKKSISNRITHGHGNGHGNGRNTGPKDNFDTVWASSDASGSSHNRQRL